MGFSVALGYHRDLMCKESSWVGEERARLLIVRWRVSLIPGKGANPMVGAVEVCEEVWDSHWAKEHVSRRNHVWL